MAANLAESEAALSALNQENDAPAQGATGDVPSQGDSAGTKESEKEKSPQDDSEDDEEPEAELRTYASAANPTYTLDIHLIREDKSNDFHATMDEIKELLEKRLRVPEGALWSVDTSPFKKITIEIHESVPRVRLNLTQSLQVKKGLWTRPLQAPEKDRTVYIKWASMGMNNADIQAVLKHFGPISEMVDHVCIEDNGKDEWTKWMKGVKTSERKCKMAVVRNIPSLI